MVTLYSLKRKYDVELKGTNHSNNSVKGYLVPDHVNVNKFHCKLNYGNRKESRNYLKLDIIPPIWDHEIVIFSEVNHPNNSLP